MENVQKKKKKKQEKGKEKVEENHFNKLPRDCLEAIFSLTTPRDVCRFSVVSSDFECVSKSDDVWERFIPSNIKKFISKFTPSLLNLPSKKELYFNLCDNPILLGCGTRSFALEKSSGKKCYMLGARYLYKLWGSNPSNLKWRSFHGSRFAEVAEFADLRKIRVSGALITSDLSPKTLYGAYFVFKLWSTTITTHHHKFPKERGDGWMEIEMGHFFYDAGQDPGSEAVKMCFVCMTNRPKSGLVVEGIEVRPKAS